MQMAETTTTDDGSTSDTTDTSDAGLMDQAISFMKEPLGMGMAAGAIIALFLMWRVF